MRNVSRRRKNFHAFMHSAREHSVVQREECEGDTVIPSVDPEVWREVAREVGKADEKNECDYTFINYERVK